MRQINYKRPKNIVIYGNTLNIFTLMQGLLKREVSPDRIIWLEPKRKDQKLWLDPVSDESALFPEPFEEDELIRSTMVTKYESMGIEHIKNIKITGFEMDPKIPLALGGVKFVDVTLKKSFDKSLKAKKTEKAPKISTVNIAKEQLRVCSALITTGPIDADDDVFHALHDNGLVYNGRLIVDKYFRTTDPNIIACGSLCEFSQKYKAQCGNRKLRMESFNGREIGLRMATTFLEMEDNIITETIKDASIPQFFLPKGIGGMLLDEYYY